MSRTREDTALRPIGLALTAVVAGLGVHQGAAGANLDQARLPASEQAKVRVYAPEPAQNDPELALGPSAPVEPFSERNDPKPSRQPDLFEL
jgi:hypothetical protein